MRFEKWQALGNDYLIVEQEQLPFELTPARARRLCDSHFGVGSDGVLLLERCAGVNVARLAIFNPDGSRAELSGNGARQAILYLRHRGWTDRDVFSIETDAGEIRPTITGPWTCRVDMGRARLTSRDFPGGPADGLGQIALADPAAPARQRAAPLDDPAAPAGQGARGTWAFRHVSIGNPQCAIRVEGEDRLAALDLPALGPAIEGHERFPNRTNVSWYTALGPDRIRARIFERGVGETLSSGTGASGAAVAHLLGQDADRGRTGVGGQPRRVTVVLDGGELEVEVGEDLRVNLTGWGKPVFAGELSEELVKELHETE